MRASWLGIVGAVLLAPSCTCNKGPQAPDAGVPRERDAGAAAAEAPVSEPVRLLREADTAFQAQKYDEAIDKAQKAVQSMPNNALAHNVIGRAAAARYAQSKNPRDLELARKSFQTAAEKDPSFWPALQNLGDLEEREGNTQAAAELYRRVLQQQPGHPEKERFEKVIAAAFGLDGGGAMKR